MSSPSTPQQGQLLLAHSSLHGSYFGRTVILLTEVVPEKGVQGLVLNRPAENHTLKSLMPSPDFAPLATVPVFVGGPVRESDLMLVGLRWNAGKARMEHLMPLGISGAVKARADGWEIRAFLGYTGWADGQLEGELEQAAWVVSPPKEAATNGEEGPALWVRLLSAMDDPVYTLMARSPDDPGLN